MRAAKGDPVTGRSLRIVLLLALAVVQGCAYAVVPQPMRPLDRVDRSWRVYANQGWQDTQLFVAPGDVVRLRASGIWDPGGSMPCTAAGAHFPIYRYSPLFALFYLPNPDAFAPINELLARVGPYGQVFRVGVGRDLVVVEEGTLQLRPNDWYLGNGTGYVDVRVAREPANSAAAPERPPRTTRP